MLATLEATWLHDRANLCMSLLPDRLDYMDDASIINAIELCYLHDRLKVTKYLMEKKAHRFCKFSQFVWTDLFNISYLHDRSKLMQCALNSLPLQATKNLNQKLLDLIFVHDRKEIAIQLLKKHEEWEHENKKQMEAEEHAYKLELEHLKFQDYLMTNESKNNLLEEKENDLKAKEAQKFQKDRIDKKKISILNPSGIKICVTTESEEDQCSMCLEFRRNVINVGCGHASICLHCCSKFLPETCPTCQIPVTSWLVIS